MTVQQTDTGDPVNNIIEFLFTKIHHLMDRCNFKVRRATVSLSSQLFLFMLSLFLPN